MTGATREEASTAKPGGKDDSRDEAAGGAARSYVLGLLLACGSREGLQGQLHAASWCKIHRLAELRLEPVLEPEPELCQRGPSTPYLQAPRQNGMCCEPVRLTRSPTNQHVLLGQSQWECHRSIMNIKFTNMY